MAGIKMYISTHIVYIAPVRVKFQFYNSVTLYRVFKMNMYMALRKTGSIHNRIYLQVRFKMKLAITTAVHVTQKVVSVLFYDLSQRKFFGANADRFL